MDRDPGSGSFLTPGSRMEKSGSRIRDSDSGINIPDHISDSLVTMFWVNNTLILCHFSVVGSDPEYGAFLTQDPGKTSRICFTVLYVKNFIIKFLAGVKSFKPLNTNHQFLLKDGLYVRKPSSYSTNRHLTNAGTLQK